MKSQFYRLSTLFCLILLWVISCKTAEPVIPKSADKVIAGFAFNALSPAVTATVDGAAKTVMATVPFGTDVTKLVPTIAVSTKATVFPASGVAQDFTKFVTYTVTAEDGTTQTYAVAVGVGAAPKSPAKDITAFTFSGLSPVVTCVVDGTTKAISATLPAGTDATKLVPTLTVSAKATVSPATGVAQDFTKAVIYTVTAEDGSKQAYTATIVAPAATTKVIDCSNIPDVWEDLGDGVDYIVKCSVRINSKLITIKPGVKIQFDGGLIDVYSNGSLKMIGTKEKPIILEGTTATQGFWKGVEITSSSVDNQWEYVTVCHAGRDQDAGLVLGYHARLSIKNCTISDNKGYGILQSDGTTSQTVLYAFANNVFTNNTKAALQITQSDWGSLDSKSSYANNGQKFINVITGSFAEYDDVTIQKIDVPYRITEVFLLKKKVTINPGVTIEFGTDAGFDLGSTLYTGALIAKGTAADPIKMSGYIAGKGIWAGIILSNNSPENNLDYCFIDGAGSPASNWITQLQNIGGVKIQAAITIDGTGYRAVNRGTITNCTISNSAGFGIVYSNYSKDAVTLKNNTCKDNAKACEQMLSY